MGADVTAQEVFDRVAAHLLRQDVRSVRRADGVNSLGCAYRGEGGLRCAIGCLIPDARYELAMEGLSLFELLVDPTVLTDAGVDVERDMWLLEALQRVHDRRTPATWRHYLAQVAEHYGLSTAVLDAPSSG